ncbi:hypothetical protein [Cupriavidus necator]
MSQEIALAIVAAGGVIFTAVGTYAVILQAVWMSRPLELDKDNEQ